MSLLDHLKSPRLCSRCGDRDPMWSGLPRPGWELVDGKLICTDCLWMTAGTCDRLHCNDTIGPCASCPGSRGC